jgi:hypothetical protein
VKIAGRHTFDSPRGLVWPHISDPAALAHLIPGCQQLQQAGPNEYRGQVQIPVPAVAGVYDTVVRLAEDAEPFVTRFDGEMAGPAGALRGKASFRLDESADGCTLAYEGDAIITGPLGRMDGRFTEGVARAMIAQGLGNLDARLRREAVEVAARAATAAPKTAPAGAWRGWPRRFIAWLRQLFGLAP